MEIITKDEIVQIYHKHGDIYITEHGWHEDTMSESQFFNAVREIESIIRERMKESPKKGDEA